MLVGLLGNTAVLKGQQQLCDGNRFYEPVFDSLQETSNIIYARDTRYNGDSVALKLDIYRPQSDTASQRPLVILAHGGAFFTGNKNQSEITFLAEALTRRGYVTASIQYRLDNVVNLLSNNAAIVQAATRAQQDGRAAVRFFRHSFANGNPYGIDTGQIYLGGSSAGAVLSLHAAYTDSAELANFPGITNPGQLDTLDGIAGDGGHPGYRDDVAGLINLCGALGRADWIDEPGIGLISLHGNQDQVVPYGSGAFSDPTGSIFNVPVEGSAKLDAQATAIGAPSRFYTWRGTGHAPYSTNTAFRDTTIRFVTRHLYEWVCDQPPLHVLRSKQDVSCPNGADGQLSIKPRNGTPPYTIQWADTASNDTLRSGLAPGTYVVTVTDSSGLDRRDSITLTAPSPINSIGIPTAASGPDASDGSINLIVNGGNGDYSYSWSNGDTVQDPQGLPPGTYSVTITDAEGCTATDTFSIGTTTARPRDQAPAQLRLAPNPSDGRVRLSFAKPVRQARVSVLNAQGQQLWQKRVSGPSAQLSLAGQPAGVYLLRISTPRQQYVRRLMLR